jgi:hypothetical protein
LNMWQYKNLGEFFRQNISYFQRELGNSQTLRFYWKTIDWANIVRQIHIYQKPFNGWKNSFGGNSGGDADGDDAPFFG